MGATRNKLILAALCLLHTITANGAVAGEAGYLGNAACTGCHEQAAVDWTNSHHDLAMQEATPQTVLGDFNNATFEYFGVTTTFSRDGEAFFVTTDDAAG
ncbi:MAG: hypothetical protein VW806_13845, partial [Halieaceae bacterium]